MDLFIQNIQGIYDYVQALDVSNELIDSKIIHKQYIAYYLYRIICKYYNIISSITNTVLIREKIFTPLKIPHNYEGCYALGGRMIRDEDTLDVVINNMIKLLKAFEKKKTGLLDDSNQDVHDFNEFISSKNTVKSINNDIIALYKYLPGISGGAPVPNVKELMKSIVKPKSNGNNKNVKNTNTNTNTSIIV
jgi:hypothetical protein